MSILTLPTAILVLAASTQSQPIPRPVPDALPPITRPLPTPQAPETDGEPFEGYSDLSGQEGDTTAGLTGSSPVHYIQVFEHNDRPCSVRVYGDDWFEKTDSGHCSNSLGISLNDYWSIIVPEGSVVHAIQPCFRHNNGRLKGLRVFFDDNGDEGRLTEFLPNCNDNWSDRVDCPQGSVMHGLRLHFETRNINRSDFVIGLQIYCAPV